MHTLSTAPTSTERNERLLADVATRLASKEGRNEDLRDEAIARWVREAAAQFVGAPVQIYVPVLVEHIVRQKITASRQRTMAEAGAGCSRRWTT